MLHPQKTKPKLYEIPLLANGVKKPIKKFPSQLQAVAREACFARVRSGKVSPMTTHANGPLSYVQFLLRQKLRTDFSSLTMS